MLQLTHTSVSHPKMGNNSADFNIDKGHQLRELVYSHEWHDTYTGVFKQVYPHKYADSDKDITDKHKTFSCIPFIHNNHAFLFKI